MRGPAVAIVALALFCLLQTSLLAQSGTGTISGTVYNVKTNQPLAYANVIVMGTNLGAMSLADGKFSVKGVPAGTYAIKAMMMGYKAEERSGVVVNAGKDTKLDFKLDQTIVMKTQEIVVTAEKKMIEVTASDARGTVTSEQLEEMPVDDVLEAVALKAGIVKGDEMHVRGGRGSEVQIQIDGVAVDDPLGGGTVGVGLLGTAGSEIVSGGMDAEYGDAQSAVINITTKEGGRRFAGEFRYFTDDFGRQDKTYTNFDRVSLGFGGPTWWKSFRYYVSGEATFSDTENTTIEPRPEHKITNWLKFRERQTENYNFQSKLTYNRQRVKVSGEVIMSSSRRDRYYNNWNIEGYVEKIYFFQSLRRLVETQPGEIEELIFGRIVRLDHGSWAKITDPGELQRKLNIRPVNVWQDVRDEETGLSTTVPTGRFFRAADIGGITVIWDENVTSASGATYTQPWVLFSGFQNPSSEFKPFLRDPSGADSAFVPFNSASRTPQTVSDHVQFKIGFNHNITSKLLYTIKVSRLQLSTRQTVNDEFGNPKQPHEFASAGLPTMLPNGAYVESGITQASYYTDNDHPYFVTSYDYPFYGAQETVQYLIRGDITSEQIKGHRVKTGVQLIYNDLNDDERTNPALRRFNTDSGTYQQGLNVNMYRNFNTEGALYAQDKWEYQGMVVNGGLRFEFFSTGNNTEIEIHNSEIEQSVDQWKFNLSPRLGFAFPITDRDKFFFHYGRFTQWPSRVFLFKTQDAIGSLGTLGNPNLQPELTVSHQAGISHQCT